VKSSSSLISSAFGGSAGAPENNAAFCAPSIAAIVSPWEQCTSVTTATFWLPAGNACYRKN
jgi:hypothetical protein